MDIVGIKKVANRKNLSADVEKLREKVARENRKIIKLKVAQDTAYWDVKEKLRQTVSKHEKLQQNMVEVQMQYETVSGKYQDELRFRPETLNKLTKTREICDVLEEYSERLRDTVSRCKADQTALYEAYQQSGQLVRDLKDKQARANENNRMVIGHLEDKLKLSTSHNAQMIQLFNMEKQRLETELSEAKSKLNEATRLQNEIMAAGRQLDRDLDQLRRDAHQKDETINELRKEGNRILQEYKSQLKEMQTTIHKQENDLKESSSSIEALQQALGNQEVFSKSVLDEKTALQDKVAALEEDLIKKGDCIRELQLSMQEIYDDNENLKKDYAGLGEDKNKLEMQIQNKIELITKAQSEVKQLRENQSAMQAAYKDIEAAATAASEQVRELKSTLEVTTATIEELNAHLKEMESNLNVTREESENKIKELTSIIEDNDRKLKARDQTISSLMMDVKSKCDVQKELNNALQNLKKEIETDRSAMMQLETTYRTQIEQLDATIKNKEEELRRKDNDVNQQMTMIMELRSDKERLNAKVKALSNKINNIHKELTGPTVTRPLTRAEQDDDNAVMLTPAPPEQRNEMSADFQPPAAKRQSRPAQRRDEVVFNFFSESSADSLDPVLVNRRFEALSRGERVSPVPLSALKKRRAATPIPRMGAPQNRSQPAKEDNIPLSQLNAAAADKKPRTFFKHKRPDNRGRRGRQD